jgi:hypothetical protein
VDRVAPNTRQVIVSESNFQAGPASQQNQLVGDTLTFGIHVAQTTDDTSVGTYVSPLEHLRIGTRIVKTPSPD